jgi:hypothetical protein
MGLDPLSYLREALAGLFTLGEKPTTEQLVVGGAVAGLNPSPIENSGFPREEFSWFQSDPGIVVQPPSPGRAG